MAGTAAFKAYGRVFESEGSAFVAVAAETARVVGGEHAAGGGLDAAMRIVAIDAAHGAFGHAMVIGFLELRPDILMASGALGVDLRRFADYQAVGAVGMDLVTGHAGDRVIAVAALQASDVGGLVEMAGEAGLVGGRGGELGGIADESCVARAGVQRTHAVAGFTAASFESAFGGDLDDVVGTLQERIVDVFVAGLAGF